MTYTGPCPNKNSKEWKDMVKYLGEKRAWYLWDKTGDKPFTEHPSYAAHEKEGGEEYAHIMTAKEIYYDLKASKAKEVPPKEQVKEEGKGETENPQFKKNEAEVNKYIDNIQKSRNNFKMKYNMKRIIGVITGVISFIGALGGLCVVVYVAVHEFKYADFAENLLIISSIFYGLSIAVYVKLTNFGITNSKEIDKIISENQILILKSIFSTLIFF